MVLLTGKLQASYVHSVNLNTHSVYRLMLCDTSSLVQGVSGVITKAAELQGVSGVITKAASHSKQLDYITQQQHLLTMHGSWLLCFILYDNNGSRHPPEPNLAWGLNEHTSKLDSWSCSSNACFEPVTAGFI